MQRRRSTTMLLLATLACTRPGDTTAAGAEAADPVPQLSGDWLKTDDRLPPVSLSLVQTGTKAIARLRLSGTESTGSGVVTAAGLTLTFSGRVGPLTGVLESDQRLRVRLAPGAEEMLLVRQPK